MRIALQIEKNRAHGRALLRGIADYALEHTDWQLELVEPEKLRRAAYLSQFDGLIVRVMDDATSAALVKSGKPVVDTYGRIDRNPLPSIRLDDAKIAAMAFAAFRDHHHRSFAYCGFPGLRFSDARGAAFAGCARREGLSVSSYAGASTIADTFFRDEKTDVPDRKSLAAWLKSLPKPTALFCCNDLRAVQVLTVCTEQGISVPNELAVLGVDNDVLLCTFTKPSLSSVETDPFALGRIAAEMLDERLQRPRKGAGTRGKGIPVRLHEPKKVVERMSMDAYPFRTPWMDEAIRFIGKNLTCGVTADDVVRHIGYSHPTVNAAFSAELGHTVKREILLRRFRQACLLLKNTSLPAGEVALRCGFRSPAYFSHSFADEFKMTPDAWRRQ